MEKCEIRAEHCDTTVEESDTTMEHCDTTVEHNDTTVVYCDLTRVLTTGQEEHNKPESSAAKLYCLHLQGQACKPQAPKTKTKAKPCPYLGELSFA